MYYRLTMKDNTVVYVPVTDLIPRPNAPTFERRLKQLMMFYPECRDWEMVEPEEVREVQELPCGYCGQASPPGLCVHCGGN
jgi:hypothetical protein